MTHDPTASPGVPEPSASLDDDLEPADGADDLEALMLRLRGIADRVDAPPPVVTDLARAAFETRDLDAELAVLTADSDVDSLALTRAGGTATAPRMVSFEADSLTVELQIDHTDVGMSIRGLVIGRPGDVVIELDTGHDRDVLTLDADGWFGAVGVPVGRVRLLITEAGGPVVATPWIAL